MAEKEKKEKPPVFTDKENSDLYVEQHRDSLRYVPGISKDGWISFQNTAWHPSHGREEELLAEITIDRLHRESAKHDDQKAANRVFARAKSLEQRAKMKNMIESAKPKLYEPLTNFESNPLLLNCGNGEVDLRSRKLSDHSPESLCLHYTDVEYHPNADQSLWLEFLNTTHGGRQDVISFLKRSVGYSLSGLMNEEVFWYVYGETRTGKGTFLRCIWAALGGQGTAGYGAKVTKRAFTPNITENQKYSLVGYQKQRFLWVDEINIGDRIDCAKLKDWVGGDPIIDRNLYTNKNEQFQPKGKIWFHGNHFVGLDPDDSVFRKMHLVEFKEPLAIDLGLKDELTDNHLEAVLAWGVEGFQEYQEQGLAPPKSVVAGTQQYQKMVDALGRFLDERCEIDPDKDCPSEQFLVELNRFSLANGYRQVWDRSRLVNDLAKKGINKARKEGGMRLLGVRLN